MKVNPKSTNLITILFTIREYLIASPPLTGACQWVLRVGSAFKQPAIGQEVSAFLKIKYFHLDSLCPCASATIHPKRISYENRNSQTKYPLLSCATILNALCKLAEAGLKCERYRLDQAGKSPPRALDPKTDPLTSALASNPSH